ncbi:hypothetical protein N9N28_05590 [Rubripirellula amarantea]|uniref:Uncharacterized protein n=1 Tax=Rubripirellula amarantea TaxID=2527999 RepID=A0A5C5WWK5_9BACT|nr:hypothetical protein [Rubripirellula amarantea]MDA8744086.1 hypothetical protein [Rubripirellula amarantea]TWT54521.1 hypothetical protein Pla22_21680 [Rubripirellula amarantea]
MSDAESTSTAPKIAPTLRLSRRGLIASLLAMVVVGLSVYAIFPESVGGPPVPVKVTLGRQPIETPGGAGAVLADVVIVENLTDHPIAKLTVDINGQYLYLQNAPLEPRQSLTLPQRMFTDKRSSARFEPTKYHVEDIAVTGQLPTGARGVSKFEFDH